MADSSTEPELATKAPESDANEPSMISNYDSRAQTGQSMGEHCTTDRPLTSDRQPSGTVSKYKDIEVYISKPPDYPNTNAKLLLLLTGGTGLHSTNNQLQADTFASEGFVVVMPDLFSGDPAPNSKPADEDKKPSFIEQLKMGIADTVKSFTIDMWLARHTPEKVLPIIHSVLDSASDEFADAKEHGGGVYAVGYCFGAKYALILAGEHVDTAVEGQDQKDEEAEVGMPKKGPSVKCAAIAHGTMVEKEDLKAVRSPSLLICVENDPLFPSEILDEGRKYFAENNVRNEIIVYPGAPHGFAVLGDYESPTIREAQQQAFTQISNWLKAH